MATTRKKFSNEFFLRCFLVRYLMYRLEKGMYEVRTSLLSGRQQGRGGAEATRLQQWVREGMWSGREWQVGVLCFVAKEGRVSLRSTGLTLALQVDNLSELTSLAIDLDTVVQKLLKRGGVEHLVGGRDRVVDVELVQGLAGGGGGSDGGFGLLEGPSIEHRASSGERCDMRGAGTDRRQKGRDRSEGRIASAHLFL